MHNFKNLSDDKKIVFFLEMSMKTVSLLNSPEHKSTAEKTIEYCWKWLYNKNPDGDFLYELLVNENNGITILAENTENVLEQSVWNCIIDAVAFTSRKAYEYENTEYYPEPVELVSDELIFHFMECYKCCFPDDNYMDNIEMFFR